MRKLFYIVLLCSFATVSEVQSQSSTRSPNASISSLTANVTQSYNRLHYQKSTVRSAGEFDVGYGLTYRIQPSASGHLQIAIGANYRTYHGNAEFKGFKDSVRMFDPSEGHRYFLYQIFNSTELQTVSFIEPSIRIEYLHPVSPFVDLLFGFGVGFGIKIRETNKMTGSYKRYAYFYENHNLIDDLPSMNLGTYTDFLNPLPGKIFNTNWFALWEIGPRFNILPNWQLYALFSVQTGFVNIQAKRDVFTHHESYSGIIASRINTGIFAFSTGFEIGISHRFGKFERRPQQQSSTY